MGLIGHYLDFLRAWITGSAQRLPKAYIYAMFEASTYDGTAVTNLVPLTYTELDKTLDRICRLAPYRIN